MSIEARREYLGAIRNRYRKANRRQKGVILAEFCQVCGYSRKYAIRILSGRLEPRQRKAGPKVTYGLEVVRHLRLLWLATGEICSKHLKAALPQWLGYYTEPGLTDEVRQLLLSVSPATIDRLLKPYRLGRPKGMSATKGATNKIKARIPIQLIIGREITKPGFLEADTVAHCGNSLAGFFVNSLTMTDLFSGWTENRATWTKGQTPVMQAIRAIEHALPFAMNGFACDNGSEFLNYELLKYFRMNREHPVEFTRRRPYKKNDNAHVEQKNWTHVRQLFGYDRLEERSLVELMNEVYEQYANPLQNFFIPSVRLAEKTRIGGRIQKKYDLPKTPYQRLLDCADLSSEAKDKLRLKYQNLNPFELRQGLQQKLEVLWQTNRRQMLRYGS